MAAQTAGTGLLLGTLSGAAIVYLNSDGVKKWVAFITVAGRQEDYKGAIEVFVYSKMSQSIAYTSQPAPRNEDSTKFLNLQQIKWKTFWFFFLLVPDLSTFPGKIKYCENIPPPKI